MISWTATGGSIDCAVAARAAIEAMIEPTDKMVQNGLEELQENLGDMSVITRDPQLCYQAMIRAALTDGGG